MSMKQVAQMGNLGGIAKLLPGTNISENQIASAENKMQVFEIMINSMTMKERKNPKYLKHPKRKERIIKGSGRTVQEYNSLVNQFEKSQKQMKEMAKYIKMGKLPNMGGGFNGFR
jgi:signal recognition particle subunit SRP54